MATSQKWLVPLAALLLSAAACGDPLRSAATAPVAGPGTARTLLQGPEAAAPAVNHSLQAADAATHATLLSSPAITAFDTRDAFDTRTVEQTENFASYAGFVGQVDNPFTTKGVTYTTGDNIIIGGNIGFPITTPVVCYNSYTPMQGLVGSASQHYTLFGFDLTLLSSGDVSPVTVTLTTNLGTYTYTEVNAARSSDATFLGFATTAPGEYFTGFTIAAGRPDNAPCLKNVSVGSAQPLDNTPPQIVPTIAGTKGRDDWYTSPVSLTWAVTDAESPVSAKTGCDALSLGDNQAATTYTCTATSLGGTASQAASVKIDRTLPTVTGAVTSGHLGNEGWYTSDVGVTWTTGAAGPSGLVRSSDCARTTVTTDSRAFTLRCVVTSGAGLASAPATMTIKRDASAPVVNWSGNAGTYTVADRVSITCSATDTLSGVASTTCANVTGDAYNFPAGVTSYSASATDHAGNTSAVATTSFTVRVDAAGLCTLVQRWTDGAGVASSLCDKLSHGDYASFRNEVSAQTGKKIPADHAAVLLRLVNAL